jgi:hypothetical protein
VDNTTSENACKYLFIVSDVEQHSGEKGKSDEYNISPLGFATLLNRKLSELFFIELRGKEKRFHDLLFQFNLTFSLLVLIRAKVFASTFFALKTIGEKKIRSEIPSERGVNKVEWIRNSIIS